MSEPRLAPVRPRISAPATGESILLADYLHELIERGRPFSINICGPPGSGKRTAIRHLAALDYKVRPVFLEYERVVGSNRDGDPRFVVRAQGQTARFENVFLQPWTTDDLIEYLLSIEGVNVGEVIARCEQWDLISEASGVPAICRLVVDALMCNDQLSTVSDCIRFAIRELVASDRQYARALRRSIGLATGRGLSSDVTALLRMGRIAAALSAELVLKRIQRGNTRRLPSLVTQTLLSEVVELARPIPGIDVKLGGVINGRNAGFFASVLHAIDPQWRPDRKSLPHLKKAVLARANWSEADLTGIHAERSDLAASDFCSSIVSGGYFDRANLCDCRFNNAEIRNTTFLYADINHATFRSAVMEWCLFGEAALIATTFEGARMLYVNFRRADLTKSSFTRASLSQCTFGPELSLAGFFGCDATECRIEKAVLRDVDLNHSSWGDSQFCDCDFERASISNASFRNSKMVNTDFTASRMRDVDMMATDLSESGLADIDWQGVDLRDADLRRCAFHMGSSRSGLVGSPYPGHGSKTGFYTDDFDDSWHRPVEEIRKANLSGCDLRGARIEDTDFYLVDLRGALYDRDQHAHFVRCDAILTDRQA